MKTPKSLFAFVLAFALYASADAQVTVNVAVGTPPAWAPATPAGVEYYYLPDIDSYYDIRTTEYIYVSGGHWIRSRELPVAYRAYRPTPARTISVAYVCLSWCGTMRLEMPTAAAASDRYGRSCLISVCLPLWRASSRPSTGRESKERKKRKRWTSSHTNESTGIIRSVFSLPRGT